MNNKTDILNELKALSPILLELKEKEKGLTVPNNYFEQLADHFLTEIKTDSGLLASLKKEKTAVPAAYFETFADTIITKINTQEKTIGNGKIIALPKLQNKVYLLFTRVALAASIIGAIFLVKHIQEPGLPVNNCKDGIACLTQDEIYNYMNANSHDFDIEQIQETVQPAIEKTETKIDIDKKEATQYIEENKNMLDVDDASTDIF